jgi:hypothetical protein
MLTRTLAVPALLAASVAVPYVATNAPEWKKQLDGPAATASSTQPFPAIGAAADQRAAMLAASPTGPGATLYPAAAPLEGAPTYSIAEVFRMDVTKEWVYQRWPRKSTGLAELDLYGIRVPLVTGTQLHDVAGSLTYFFDSAGRVQRISFRGRTGDTTQLVGMVTQRFALTPQQTIAAGEQLYEVRRGPDVISRLRTRPAAVLWASSPHDSFSVELDLQDAAGGRPLASEIIPLPAPVAPPPTTSAAAQAAAAEGASSEESDGETKPSGLGWKAFFPRQRASDGQIRNLDRGNMYQ